MMLSGDFQMVGSVFRTTFRAVRSKLSAMRETQTTLVLDPLDNVVVLTERMPRGALPIGIGAPLTNAVGAGHKIASRDIQVGESIIKFGQIIGYASNEIERGDHVHSHNCAFGGHDRQYKIGADLEAAYQKIPELPARTFRGYLRADGQVGTRNMIALCATVNCSATVIRKAAEAITNSGILSQYQNVDGIVAFAHGTGCGMATDSRGYEHLQRVLWGHATHPNVGAAIFVGLGCEVMQIASMRKRFRSRGAERFHGLTIQESGGTSKTVLRIVEQVHALLPEVNRFRREEVSASELKIALQCGGSDGFSSITANPALGAASDLLVGLGGTVILAETPEIYGAEQILFRRAKDNEIAQKLIRLIDWWEEYTQLNGGTMDNNPSPGNKAGGLTTILEKSLGAAVKAGSTPLMDVLDYGEQVLSKGFVFMDSPGYDPVSVTGQIAAGAQIVVFTTGRGSAFGSKPSPTIKLATNDFLYDQMADDMDLNCGDIVSQATSIVSKGQEILEKVLRVASGEQTKSEALNLGDNEFVPWQVGAVM